MFLNVRLKHDSVQCQNEQSKFQQNISNIVVFDNALHDRLFESFDTLDVCKWHLFCDAQDVFYGGFDYMYVGWQRMTKENQF